MNCSSSLLRAATSWGVTAGDSASSSCSCFPRWAWWASCRSRALSQWARSRREVARSRTALSLSASCSSSQPSATRREQSPLVSMERLNSRRDCKRRAVHLRVPPRKPPGCVPTYPSFTQPSTHSPVHLICPPTTCHYYTHVLLPLIYPIYLPIHPSIHTTYCLPPSVFHLPIHPAVHPSTLNCPSLPRPSSFMPTLHLSPYLPILPPPCSPVHTSSRLPVHPPSVYSIYPPNNAAGLLRHAPRTCWRHSGQHKVSPATSQH